MRFSVTITANAGVICECGDICFLVDALHCDPNCYWTTLTPELSQTVLEMVREKQPKAILFTHHHADHFSPELAERAKEMRPGFYRIPGDGGAEEGSVSIGPMEIRWMHLEHDDPEEYGIENTGYFISLHGRHFLFPGDCPPGSPEVKKLTRGENVDVAFLNFSWIVNPRGRKGLEEFLRPGHIVCEHLPCGGKDPAGFLFTVRNSVRRYCHDADIRIMDHYLQNEIFEL